MINIVSIFLDEEEISVSRLTQIIYKLYKIDINDEELLKESLLDILGVTKELLKELVNSVTNLDLIQ